MTFRPEQVFQNRDGRGIPLPFPGTRVGEKKDDGHDSQSEEPDKSHLEVYARQLVEDAKKKQEPLLKFIYTVEALIRSLTTRSHRKH